MSTVEERTRVKVWFNPHFGCYLATPDNGPVADELYARGATEEEALDNLGKALEKRGLLKP